MYRKTNGPQGDLINAASCRITGGFWGKRQKNMAEHVLFYQWEVLNDRIPGIERSGAVHNFRVAAGEEEGEFYGRPFQDSDLYKWLEAAAYALAIRPDERLERLVEEAVSLVQRAQAKDGYLDTLYIIGNQDKRFTNLRDKHELYCAGHLIEAAVAFARKLNRTELLKVAEKLTDHIISVFGAEEGKLHGYPGHPEIELALIKLYHCTGHRKYLDLASYFIDERGREPRFYDMEAEKRGDELPPYGPTGGKYTYEYNQSHMPVRQQRTAVGHAVRALYLYSAMTELAGLNKDAELKEAVGSLWENVTQKQMYITGAVGSSQFGEAFSADYDLPNDTAYNETCASVALVMWAYRMLQLKPEGAYADIMERALYNGVLSGISLEGTKYFYVNPLEIKPQVCGKRNDMQRTAIEREPWFVCSCCPTNAARLLLSLSDYFYTCCGGTLWLHLYDNSTISIEEDGGRLDLIQTTGYPWEGNVSLKIRGEGDFTLALRIPGWCGSYSVTINNRRLLTEAEKGYIYISRHYRDGDEINLRFEISVEKVYASPLLKSASGKAAIRKGPFVYCIEEIDNGSCLSAIKLASDRFKTEHRPELLEGIDVIETDGFRDRVAYDGLYYSKPQVNEEVTVRLIPYYTWNNRGIGEMAVWIRDKYG
jgi:DUF1680 family protein